jgi:hypothetical protein
MDEMLDVPRNVRMVKANGTEIPMEMVYAGKAPTGEDIWSAVQLTMMQKGDRIKWDYAPPNCFFQAPLRVAVPMDRLPPDIRAALEG